MPLVNAQQAEIIRANQKDDYYSRYIRGSLADVVQSIFGPRQWLKWSKEIDLSADLAYFGLTTFAGFQTLGEEYVNIVQVDHTKRAVPTLLQRGVLVLLATASPYIIDRLLQRWEKQLRQDPNLSITPQARSKLIELLPIVRHVITIVHRCHLAAFYMRGVFYHLSKRFTYIRYLLVRGGDEEVQRPNYKILGWLAIIQLSLTLGQQLYKSFQRRNVSTPEHGIETAQLGEASTLESRETMASQRCALCLEARQNSTATPCGHLFCWHCIHEWCANKAECPLCREKFGASRLIALQHYDTT